MSPSPDDRPIAAPNEPQTATLAAIVRFLQVVRIRRGILFCTLFISTVLGGLYFAPATRLYESKARLYVLQMGSNVLQNDQENQGGVQENMATNQGVLTSDVVLEEALQKLPAKHRIDLKGIPRSKWTEALRNNLAGTAPRRTNLIDVRYRSRDPQVAATVVNHIVESYLTLMQGIHKNNAGNDIQFMTAEKKKLDEETNRINSELLDLKRQLQIISGPDNQSINPAAERVAALNKELIVAQNRTREARATLEAIVDAAARGQNIEQFAMQHLEVVGKEFLLRRMGLDSQDSWMVMRVRQQLINDQVELQNKSGEYGPNHPLIQKLTTRIRDRQKWLAERPKSVVDQMQKLSEAQLTPSLIDKSRQRLLYADSREAELRQDFERENRTVSSYEYQMSRIKLLNFDLARKRELSVALIDQINRTDLGKERGGLRTKIVSHPKAAKLPVTPRLLVVALCALACGLGGGLGVIYILDVLDDRFRSPEELRLQLDVPVLALVGEMPVTDEPGLSSVRMLSEPNSTDTEAFRTLRTALSFAGRPTQQLVVTSTEPGDGKTTVLTNLGVAFAQSGKRTLVIDADMRRPGLTRKLNLKGPRGLSTILQSEEPIGISAASNLLATELNSLDVIPAGPRPGSPAELLHGGRFAELIAWAESAYDQILIDAPPTLAVSDPAIIGTMVDGVLLVVRPGTNRRRMVLRAAESITAIDADLLGVVINNVDSDTGSDYDGYGYEYGGEDEPASSPHRLAA